MKERRHAAEDLLAGQCISTHAPVKERLLLSLEELGVILYFNSRSCEGATGGEVVALGLIAHFNSRSCEGATIKTRKPSNIY